jgi:hypothetical protein
MDTDSGRDATVVDRRAAMPRRGHPPAPIAELVKTRQCPPCTPISAAAIPTTATRVAAITIVAASTAAIPTTAMATTAMATAASATAASATAAPATAPPAAAISATAISVAALADTVDALDRIPAIRRTIVLNGRYAVSRDSGRAAGVPGSTPCHHGAR